MNLVRPQTPYRFMPPKYSPAFRPVLHLLVRWSLRFEYRITQVRIEGAEAMANLVRQGHSVLVAPNHADHADPSLVITVGRRHGLAFHFMAAREGFERNRLHQWVLQKSGAFSINREGADMASIKMAIQVLQEGRHPLVIFPEGEIYHHMEELDELNEGVASIALRAAARLPQGRRGFVVPASIRLLYDPGVAELFNERLSALEQRILIKPRTQASPFERLVGLGSALLAIKEEEFLGSARQGTLTERILHLRRSLMHEVEERHGVSNGALSFPRRIKHMRALIRKELTEGAAPPSPQRQEQLYDELDRIYAVHQLYSYTQTYLMGEPSVDRIAETIFKLEEDVFGKARYLGKRTAEVRFGEPVDLAQFTQSRGLNEKTAVAPLTHEIAERIQELIRQ